MKKLIKTIPVLPMGMYFLAFFGLSLVACDEEESLPFTASSLKVFHGAVDAPPVHVNYDGRDIPFLGATTISFGSNQKFTIPSGIDQEIRIVNSEDTLSQLLSTRVSLPVGGIGTLFLIGEGENVEGLYLNDDILTFTDSLVGVRFINLSPDSSPVSVGITEGDDNLADELAYRETSGYLALPATEADGSYTFEFKDADGNVIGSITLNPLPGFGVKPLFKNQTYALVGLANDGTGASSLSVKQINNY